jgi:hypothetical protein
LTVLTDGSTYSSGLAGSFEQNTSASVDAKRTIDPLDLEDLASQVEDSDAVFYAPSSVQNALAVAEALRGVDVRVFSTDVALDPQFLNGAGVEAARWHIVSNSVSDPALFDAFTNFGERFKQSYVARYGETPGQYAMNAYDMSTRILSHVEKLATADQDRSRDRSQILRDVWNERAEGAMGFRADGRPAGARMSGYTWRDGRFQVSNIFQVSP